MYGVQAGLLSPNKLVHALAAGQGAGAGAGI